jgi:MFS family permease
MLIVARAVQAIGGGALVPVSMAIVADYLPLERRAVGLGFLGAAAEGGGLFGPLWGGSWVQLLGWRGHFWINVPLCLPIIAIVLVFMARTGERRAEKASVDYVGGLLLAARLLAWPWPSPMTPSTDGLSPLM